MKLELLEKLTTTTRENKKKSLFPLAVNIFLKAHKSNHSNSNPLPYNTHSWLVDEVTMLLVLCQLSRDGIG